MTRDDWVVSALLGVAFLTSAYLISATLTM